MTDIQELKQSLLREQEQCRVSTESLSPAEALALIARIEVLDHALLFARGMVAYSASGYTHSGDMTNRAIKALEVIDAAIAAQSTKEQG
ncbi:MAG TPA: hypothetical protein VL528_10775 [Oxalicibacterium sp.]|jgi:hypothetical protein|nr:hypothetical protein [Oxalicibacterium sp.]